MKPRKLVSSRVLITGAGSGLGRALALHFARAGWRVAVTDAKLRSAEQTLGEVLALGAEGMAAQLDVTSESSFADVVRELVRDWDGVDVLINNAGVATAGTVAEAPLAQWRWVLDVNLLGCVRGSRAVIPLMQRQGGGHIVNVASFAGIANPPALASYNVAKAGVIALSETLRFELHPALGVSVACPSFFKTQLIETSSAAAPEGAGLSVAPQMQAITARLMESATVTAEDVAADIFDAVRKNRFLVMTHADARQRWRLKRFTPELYFRIAQRVTAGFLER